VKNVCPKPICTEHFEGVRHECTQRVRHNASVPELGAEPIADHGAGAVHIRTRLQPNSSDKHAAGHDGEVFRGFRRAVMVDPQARVFAFVGRRKLQGHVARDSRVICNTREFLDIVDVPRAQEAFFPYKVHGRIADRLVMCAMAPLRTAPQKANVQCVDIRKPP